MKRVKKDGARASAGLRKESSTLGASEENSGENSGPELAHIPQPHGGALLSGGQKGNRGGGRLPNEIRELLRQGLNETVVSRLISIAEGSATRAGCCPRCGDYIAQEEATFRESTQATATLLQYGVGTKFEMEGEPVNPIIVSVLVGPEVAAEQNLTPLPAPAWETP